MKKCRKWVCRVFMLAAAICIVTGRVKGCHMTEGEAFCTLWFFWLGGLILVICGILAMGDTD